MTDVFRVEIFAVVMQQIVDEPVLPVLFLRTVSQKTKVKSINLIQTTMIGNTGSYYLQIASRLCLDDPPFTPYYEENLDEFASVGGFHPLCQSDCSCKLQRASTIAEGPTPRTSG